MDYTGIYKKIAEKYGFREDRVREEMKKVIEYANSHKEANITPEEFMDYVIRTLISEEYIKEE